ncbi:MAG: PQQ-binding-like beta-propeller repeat protein [Candidatus Sericytochromatia bacterium]|nr:PQQ-binding-like beta-propeller repeat protein [Candidatus Sericytochromatia bacterium]
MLFFNRHNVLLLTSALLLTFFSSCQTPGKSDPPKEEIFNAPAWFTDRGNLAQTASINEEARLPLKVRWERVLPHAIDAPPAGGHGKLYVGSGKTLYALNPQNGQTVWSYAGDGFDTANPIRRSVTAVAWDKNQQQYVLLVDGMSNLHAINGENGTQIWKVVGDGTRASAPVSASQYVFYSVFKNNLGTDYKVLSLQDGALKWKFLLGAFDSTTTPVHGFGSIFLGDCSNGNYPLRRIEDTANLLKWRFYDSEQFNSGLCHSNGVLNMDVALGEAPVYYFGHHNPPIVRALNVTSGQQLWSKNLPQNSDVLGFALTQQREKNDLIVALSDALFSLNLTNGEILWQVNFAKNSISPVNNGGAQVPQPVIWGDYVFHVTGNNVLKAFELATGQETWSFTLDQETFSSPIVGGNSLYIGTGSGRVYALSPESP